MNNKTVRTMQGKMGAFAVAALLALGFALAPSARASLILQFDSQNYVAGTWTDTSGNGNNATNVTVSQQPTISGLTPGGEPALLFDGVNDRLGLTTALGSAPFTTSPNFTIVAVVKNPTTVVGGAFHNSTFLGGSVDAVDFNQQSGAGVGGSSRLYLASPGIGGVYSDFVGTNQWMIAGVTFDGATFKFYTNGVQVATAGGAITGNVFANPITTIGALSDASNFLDGPMAALYVYDTALDATAFASVNSQLYETYFVPEPSVAMLLSLGGWMIYRRRKNRE